MGYKKETLKRIKRIRLATERIGQVFYKTAPLLRQLDNETLCQLGFPPESLSYIRLQTIPFESVIARLDLAVTDEEVKLLEVNADTPTFIKETFFVNGRVCESLGLQDPNEGVSRNFGKLFKQLFNLQFVSLGKKKRLILFLLLMEIMMKTV